MRVTFLGTGTSVGVPIIGCGCAVCKSRDPRNRRMRQSVWLRTEKTSVVIDASSDFRQQVLTFGVDRIDALLLTHPHADHILGLDDTRAFSYWQKSAIPIYGNAETLEGVKKTFWYAFQKGPEGGGLPQLDLHEISRPIKVGDIDVEPLPADHGSMLVYGYRVDGFAYLTDCKRIPEETLERIEGVDTLVLNALRFSPPHPTHMTVGEALEAIKAVHPGRAFLIHMGHDLDHEELDAYLPENISPAFDGLTLEI